MLHGSFKSSPINIASERETLANAYLMRSVAKNNGFHAFSALFFTVSFVNPDCCFFKAKRGVVLVQTVSKSGP